MRFPSPRKELVSLLSDGQFHSGTGLACRLGLSRSAVWAMIHDLQARGLELSAVPGKGYRLAHPLELLDADAILASIGETARSRIAELQIHDELDSTNSHLMAQASTGAPGGTVCLAEYQTAGRGRIGRSWQTPFGAAVCLSLLWRFEDHGTVAGLSLAVGVAIHRALRRAGVEGIGLKWPNDLLWQGRKLGGILLEVSGEAHGRCAVVVGVGLNLRIPASAAQAIDQAWTDLSQISGGQLPSRNRLTGYLLEGLLELLAAYPEQGLQAYVDEWRHWHCMAGRKAVLQLGGKNIAGTVVGISDAGLLLLDCEEGGLREFASGDVRLRQQAGQPRDALPPPPQNGKHQP